MDKFDIIAILNAETDATLGQAVRVVNRIMDLHDAAVRDVKAAQPSVTVERIEGTSFRGVFFTEAADDFMRDNKKIQAIKEVRAHNKNLDGTTYGLKDCKEAVEGRMDWMGWPYV